MRLALDIETGFGHLMTGIALAFVASCVLSFFRIEVDAGWLFIGGLVLSTFVKDGIVPKHA